MRTAQDIMTTPALTISPEADVTEAVKILLEKDINGLPVMDDSGQLVGIICRSDMIRMQKSLPVPSLFTLLDGFVPLSSAAQMEAEVKRIAASKVSDAMTAKVVSIAPDTGVDDIAALIVDKKFHTLPVMDQGRLLGVVGKSDVLRTLLPR